MNIALIVNELNVRGGTHKQLQRLAKYLIESGHSIRIFTKLYDPKLCFPGLEKFEILSYEKYFQSRSKYRFLNRFRQLLGYFRIARDVKAYSRLVNIHDNGFSLTQLLFHFSFIPVKVVWQINDLPPYFRIGNTKDFAPGILDSITRFIYVKCAEYAEAITVNVSKNAERVEKYYGVPAEVVYCGVDLRYDKLTVTDIKHDSTLRLLSIGVFFPYRNYETFVKVLEYLQNELQIKVEGTIIGSTDFAPEYVNKIKNQILQSNVNCSILGNISEEVFVNTCNTSDVFLFLNQDQSWGLAVFEAMNMGLPVIISKTVGATELLQDGKNVIMVDPTDHKVIAEKIILVNGNYDFRTELVSEAFKHTNGMTWDRMYSSRIERILTSYN